MRSLTIFLSLLLAAAPLGAQCDTTASGQYLTRVWTDSIRKTHTSATTQQTVTLYQRRNLARIDSVFQNLCARAITTSVGVSFDYTSAALWYQGRVGSFPDTGAVVCASVKVGQQMRLGSSAVRVRAIRTDSVSFDELPPTDGTTFRAMCRPMWAHASESAGGYGPISEAVIQAIRWVPYRLKPTLGDTASVGGWPVPQVVQIP